MAKYWKAGKINRLQWQGPTNCTFTPETNRRTKPMYPISDQRRAHVGPIQPVKRAVWVTWHPISGGERGTISSREQRPRGRKLDTMCTHVVPHLPGPVSNNQSGDNVRVGSQSNCLVSVRWQVASQWEPVNCCGEGCWWGACMSRDKRINIGRRCKSSLKMH